MIKRTICLENPCYLSLANQQLIITYPKDIFPARSVSIEDLGIIICDNPQITITSALLSFLNQNKILVVQCGENHMPTGLTIPMESNTLFSQRFQRQITATAPLKKSLWQQTVRSKIINQSVLLETRKIPAAKMRKWAKEVLSGDINNHEARAAVYYWSKIFRKVDFLRDPEGGSPNPLLNYGYAILRSICAKSIIGSGLHPTLGIFHKNKYNPFCLADDIMEPYRPVVDQLICELLDSGLDGSILNRDIKVELLKIPIIDVKIDGKLHPLSIAMSRTTSSLVECYLGKRKTIIYPQLATAD